jgi:biotin synthase-like enzyme
MSEMDEERAQRLREQQQMRARAEAAEVLLRDFVAFVDTWCETKPCLFCGRALRENILPHTHHHHNPHCQCERARAHLAELAE